MKIIYTFILIASFLNINAQKIDSLIKKTSTAICSCIEEIDSCESIENLEVKLKNCGSEKYQLTERDSTIIENIGFKEYENKQFLFLRNNCCKFNQIFLDQLDHIIIKKIIPESEIDSIKLTHFEGGKLPQYDQPLGGTFFKVKISRIERDSCNLPKNIYVKKEGLEFRVTSFLDKNIIMSEDEYLIIGKTQNEPDGTFITINNPKEPFFYVFSVINLRTKEAKVLKIN